MLIKFLNRFSLNKKRNSNTENLRKSKILKGKKMNAKRSAADLGTEVGNNYYHHEVFISFFKIFQSKSYVFLYKKLDWQIWSNLV